MPLLLCWLLQTASHWRLPSAIKGCSSVQQLVRLIQQHLSSMDAISLSAAILKLSKLKCKEQQPYADCLQRYLKLAPAKPQARGLSNVIYALCTAPTDIVQQHCAAVSQQLLPKFLRQLTSANAYDISNMLYGMASGGQQLDPNTLQQLLDALVYVLPQAKP
jgi:hypothetical protein